MYNNRDSHYKDSLSTILGYLQTEKHRRDLDRAVGDVIATGMVKPDKINNPGTNKPNNILVYEHGGVRKHRIPQWYDPLVDTAKVLGAAAGVLLASRLASGQEQLEKIVGQEQPAPKTLLTHGYELFKKGEAEFAKGTEEGRTAALDYFRHAAKHYASAGHSERLNTTKVWVADTFYKDKQINQLSDLTPAQSTEIDELITSYKTPQETFPIAPPTPAQPTQPAEPAVKTPEPTPEPPQEKYYGQTPEEKDLEKRAVDVVREGDKLVDSDPSKGLSRYKDALKMLIEAEELDPDSELYAVPISDLKKTIKSYEPGPFGTRRLSLRGEVGPFARNAGVTVRAGPFEGLAEFDRVKLKTSDGDDFAKKYLGAAAKMDLGFFQAWAGAGVGEEFLESSSYEEIDTAISNLKTLTSLEQLTERTDYLIGGALTLGDTEIYGTLRQLEEKIGVKNLVDIMYTDKVGNGSYTDRLATNLEFVNETLGVQGGFNRKISDKFNFGLVYTGEYIDMPDFNREVDLHRAHGHLQYRGEGIGGSVIVGQGLLKDNGETLTRGEYGAVAGIANDRLAFTTRFSRVEDPRLSGRLLVGKNNNILPHLLDNDEERVRSQLNLLKRLPDGLHDAYFRARNQDITAWLARKGEFVIMAEGGTSDIERMGRTERAYNWDVTAIAPILKEVTVSGRVYQYKDVSGLVKGFELGIFPVDSSLNLFISGEQEELHGFGEKDRRALVSVYLSDILRALKGK